MCSFAARSPAVQQGLAADRPPPPAIPTAEAGGREARLEVRGRHAGGRRAILRGDAGGRQLKARTVGRHRGRWGVR